MKKQILSFTALLLALLLAGCAASAPQSGSAASASASASGAQPESAASGSADARAVTFTDALGRTVTENAGALEEMRRRLAVECTENFFREMGALGYSRGEAADMAQAERKKNDE